MSPLPDEADVQWPVIIQIAGRAGGLDPRTVAKYLAGMNTNRRKRRQIEQALREVPEWSHLVRKDAPQNRKR